MAVFRQAYDNLNYMMDDQHLPHQLRLRLRESAASASSSSRIGAVERDHHGETFQSTSEDALTIVHTSRSAQTHSEHPPNPPLRPGGTSARPGT